MLCFEVHLKGFFEYLFRFFLDLLYICTNIHKFASIDYY